MDLLSGIGGNDSVYDMDQPPMIARHSILTQQNYAGADNMSPGASQ